jgi:hypothetical protein
MEQFSDWTTISNGTEDADTRQVPRPAETAAAQSLETYNELVNGEATQPEWQREIPPWEGVDVTSTITPEDVSPLSFDQAFDVLDRQADQLRGLRGKLGMLFEYSAERDRAMTRLEQELAAARAESERERRMVADLRTELGKQDELIRSVRETVSELGRTLDSVGASFNASRAA